MLTKTSGVVQMFGVTVSGFGGSNDTRGGIVLSGDTTKGKEQSPLQAHGNIH